MEAADTKIRFINTIKIMAKGNKSAFARMLGIKPQDLYAYENGKTRIGIDMRERILRIGINPEYLSGKSIFMFADNEQGQILKQKFGDAMSSPQKAGVRFIPTTNPESRKIPVMLSPVRAGLPAWASDSIGTEVDINSLYHEKSYFVVAHGDSMTGARIQEGDWLLVDEAKAPKSSDIVVAEIDGALTVKRLKKNGVTWLLHPDSENPAYAPMEFGEGMRIVGVVVQIIVQP
jgi:DNA polymerase V